MRTGLFISHSSKDKALARRIARRLEQFGQRVWIDESELGLGSALPEQIRRSIEQSAAIAVVVTDNAVASTWVRKEIEFAKAKGIDIFPMRFVPQLSQDLTDYLAADFTNVFEFEQTLAALLGTLSLGSRTRFDAGVCRRQLQDMKTECPQLAPLISHALGEGPLHSETFEQVLESPFELHDAEFVLNSFYDLCAPGERNSAANTAAVFLRLKGWGAYVVSDFVRHKDNDTDVDMVLTGLTSRSLKVPASLSAAIKVFEGLPTPRDARLHSLVSRNLQSFEERDRDRLIQLVLHPRRGPAMYLLDTVDELLRRWSLKPELMSLFRWWMDCGYFDHSCKEEGREGAQLLFKVLRKGHEDGVAHAAHLTAHFAGRLRHLLRSGDVAKVEDALWHLFEFGVAEVQPWPEVEEETIGSLYSTEWDHLPDPQQHHYRALANQLLALLRLNLGFAEFCDKVLATEEGLGIKLLSEQLIALPRRQPN